MGALVPTKSTSTSTWRVVGPAIAKTPVRVGDRDVRSGEFPVVEGLAVGDRILRNPGSALVDGQRVEFAKGAPAAAMASASAASAAN